jgi:hypothetical protein
MGGKKISQIAPFSKRSHAVILPNLNKLKISSSTSLNSTRKNSRPMTEMDTNKVTQLLELTRRGRILIAFHTSRCKKKDKTLIINSIYLFNVFVYARASG